MEKLSNGLDTELSFDKIYNSVNIAELLTENDLAIIANMVIDQARDDENSRIEWTNDLEKIMEIAKQVHKIKTDPWEGAANVKLPIITNAAIQFAARIYPELIRNAKICNTVVIGRDPIGEKDEKAKRVDIHMNYQLLQKSDHWETGLDKLLHMLPIVGTAYKKIYYDVITGENRSITCLPNEIIVNDNIQKLSMARRITHIIHTNYNEVVERVRYGIYRDCLDKLRNTKSATSTEFDYDKPLKMMEQHRWLDLDNDGYEEPYIVTVEESSKQILRIYRCFDMDHVTFNMKGEIQRIKPKTYFIDYHFLPSPDGKFHSLGFGKLLYHLNESANSIMNEILDSGALNNLQGGFISNQGRILKGDIKRKMGRYIPVDIRSDDLRKCFYEPPTHEPSNVLLQLLNLILAQAKDLSSITDMLQGQEKPQNVKAGVSQDLIEQGLVVFNSLQARVFRGLKAELKAWFSLNSEFLTQEEYILVEGDQQAVSSKDYDESVIDIMPTADPTASSMSQRLKRVSVIMNPSTFDHLSSNGKKQALALLFDSLNIPDSQIKNLLSPETAPPSADDQLKTAQAKMTGMIPHEKSVELSLRTSEIGMKQKDQEINLIRANIDLLKAKSEMALNVATGKKMEADALVDFSTIEDNKKLKTSEIMLNAFVARDQEGSTLTQDKLDDLFDQLGVNSGLQEDTTGDVNNEQQSGTSQSSGLPTMEDAPGNTMVPPTDSGQAAGTPGQPM